MDRERDWKLYELFNRTIERCKRYEKKGDEENLYREIRHLRSMSSLFEDYGDYDAIDNDDFRYFMCKGAEHFGEKFIQREDRFHYT